MHTDGYTLATYFIKLQYIIKVTSTSKLYGHENTLKIPMKR